MADFKTMKDMRRTDAEKAESMIASSMPTPMVEDYPYGLRICLTQDELAKLGLEANCEDGDMIHLNAMATVTSCTETKTNGETSCRIELTITHMAVEDEGAEAEEADETEDKPSKMQRRYGNSTDDADEEAE